MFDIDDDNKKNIEAYIKETRMMNIGFNVKIQSCNPPHSNTRLNIFEIPNGQKEKIVTEWGFDNLEDYFSSVEKIREINVNTQTMIDIIRDIQDWKSNPSKDKLHEILNRYKDNNN